MANITNVQIEEALYKTSGNVAESARQLEIGRITLHKRIKKSTELTEALQGFREVELDIAESLVHRRLRFAEKNSRPKTPEEIEKGQVEIPPNKDDVDIAFKYLKLQGKDRGYTERQEVTGADGAPVGVLFHQGLDQIYESLKSNPDLMKKVKKELIDE
ncbi:hypothetical protein KAR91_85755 [Candidatus Pacearchaeota archaeon]|nr:hypothetical protein [Candidatus Pacearchaeota archaeon]